MKMNEEDLKILKRQWGDSDNLINDALIYIKKLQEENNLLKAKMECMEEIADYRYRTTQPQDESEIYNELFR